MLDIFSFHSCDRCFDFGLLEDLRSYSAGCLIFSMYFEIIVDWEYSVVIYFRRLTSLSTKKGGRWH